MSTTIQEVRPRYFLLRSIPLVALLSMLVIAVYVFVGLLAPLIAPHGETEIVGSSYEMPNATFLLGTDNLGRDLLSRIIYGARNTIGIALITTLLSFCLGASTGFLAATAGGWVDQALGRSVDVLMAIPKLIFALLILTILGSSVTNMILTIAILDSTRVFRLSRSLAMNVRVMEFVEIARVRGEGTWWIMRKEIFPNTIGPLLAEFGVRFTFVFLFIGSLGFLGLGIQPPTADWGSMVRDNSALITFGSVVPVLPAAAIAILALAVNFVVDWTMRVSNGQEE